MTGYIIEAEAELETELSTVMPGVVWKTWQPVYSNAVAHGQLLTTLQKRIEKALETIEGQSMSCREFKAMVLKSDRVAPQSWKVALAAALSKNPQWKQEDYWLKRSSAIGQFEHTASSLNRLISLIERDERTGSFERTAIGSFLLEREGGVYSLLWTPPLLVPPGLVQSQSPVRREVYLPTRES